MYAKKIWQGFEKKENLWQGFCKYPYIRLWQVFTEKQENVCKKKYMARFWKKRKFKARFLQVSIYNLKDH